MLSEEEKKLLGIAESKSFDMARSHIDAAKLLYEDYKWPQSCFMAMTAIEEIGKGLILQAVCAQQERVIGLDFKKGFNEKSLKKCLQYRDAHGRKAFIGTLTPLILNDEAKKRYGKHPVSGINRIEGVLHLAKADRWMKLRNMCLYIDIKLNESETDVPIEEVSREHAYIMIMAALEAYAEVYAPYFTFHNIPFDIKRDSHRNRLTIEEIEQFIGKELGKVELDRLDFLATPKFLQDKDIKLKSIV